MSNANLRDWGVPLAGAEKPEVYRLVKKEETNRLANAQPNTRSAASVLIAIIVH